uniref:FliH/SctL family protein n=1 Tax=uncultured Sphingomonas sp. TaxID=158754 RepID=UPI0025EE6AB5|nr:FliH/SctL family protein [uncultured Sphingomonas sp.]
MKPFPFDRVFATAAPVGNGVLEREHLLAELAHLRAELAGAEERGRAEGEARALERFRAERETALLSAIDALGAAFEELVEQFEAVEAEVTRDGAALAMAAAEHLAGRALAEAPQAVIDEAIGRTLGELRRGTPLEVRVSPELVVAVEAAVAERQSRDRRRLEVTVIGDATLPTGDARLLWERGGAALNAATRRETLAREIGRLLG